MIKYLQNIMVYAILLEYIKKTNELYPETALQ